MVLCKTRVDESTEGGVLGESVVTFICKLAEKRVKGRGKMRQTSNIVSFN
jgi:hypothetical protein